MFKYKSHPWHGLDLGEKAPSLVNCYIEIVPTDSVKYELDKETGILKVDRPQKFSSFCPTLYGLLPQTYSDEQVANHCMKKTGKKNLEGDGDPLDICVLTEKTIVRGDIIVRAIPVGGFRLLDGDQVDDKIIAVMVDDVVYGDIGDVSQCPKGMIDRLKHYFLTYKEIPGKTAARVEILSVYNRQEAQEIIRLSVLDYQKLVIES